MVVLGKGKVTVKVLQPARGNRAAMDSNKGREQGTA